MGIFTKASKIAGYNPATGYQSTAITGLFSPSTLAKAVFPDIDDSLLPVDMATALTCPAVFRGVQIISSIGSRLPLQAVDSFGVVHDSKWLNSTEGAITPAKRNASIVQDLIFFNESLVETFRDDAGTIIGFQHLPRWYWSLDAQHNIVIDGKRVDNSAYMYIPGLMPMGFLEAARDSVRQYRNIMKTVNNRVAAPQPITLLEEVDQPDVPATETEIDEAVANIIELLKDPARAGFMNVPRGYRISGYGSSDSVNELMLEAREALRKDLANFLGITVGLLDGSTGDSSTYQNALDERNELAELTVKSFTEPIADRLSQEFPDLSIKFDYSVLDSLSTSAKGNTDKETPNV